MIILKFAGNLQNDIWRLSLMSCSGQASLTLEVISTSLTLAVNSVSSSSSSKLRPDRLVLVTKAFKICLKDFSATRILKKILDPDN